MRHGRCSTGLGTAKKAKCMKQSGLTHTHTHTQAPAECLAATSGRYVLAPPSPSPANGGGGRTAEQRAARIHPGMVLTVGTCMYIHTLPWTPTRPNPSDGQSQKTRPETQKPRISEISGMTQPSPAALALAAAAGRRRDSAKEKRSSALYLNLMMDKYHCPCGKNYLGLSGRQF